MEFNELLEQVNKYGLPNVVSVLFMFIGYLAIKHILKLQSDMIKKILSAKNKEVTLVQIEILQEWMFDDSKNIVLRELERIYKENSLHDKEQVKNKIIDVLTNLHNKRNSQLSAFERNEIKLSEFTNPDWIEKMTDVCVTQVYISSEFDYARIYKAISVAYEAFKLEFNLNIKSKTLK